MPMYEYLAASGATLLLRRGVDQRDAPVMAAGGPWRRRNVPTRLSVCTNQKPPTMGDQLARGYYKLEEQGRLSDKKPNYLSTKTIKRALALPDVHAT